MKSVIADALDSRKSRQSFVDSKLEEFATPKIIAIGVGGAGCNAVNRMATMGISGAQLCAVNTDKMHLSIISDEITKVLIGKAVTRGLGAGGYPEIGAKAAEVSKDALEEVLKDCDMVFISAGMGGGTGTGAAPVIAEIAKKNGAITIAAVTYPFALERARVVKAEEGIQNLAKICDTVIVLDNNRLVALVPNLPIQDAFRVADEVLSHGVQAIAEVVTVPGLINLDFADVRTIMKDAGPAWMSIGHGTGQNRASDAAKEALSSPLLDVSIEGARGLLFNVCGGENLSLFEVNAAAEVIRAAVDPDANIIFGVNLSPNLGNEVRLTLIATGFSTKDAMVGGKRDKEMNKLLCGLKAEDLEVPAFLRQRSSFRPQARPTTQVRPQR